MGIVNCRDNNTGVLYYSHLLVFAYYRVLSVHTENALWDFIGLTEVCYTSGCLENRLAYMESKCTANKETITAMSVHTSTGGDSTLLHCVSTSLQIWVQLSTLAWPGDCLREINTVSFLGSLWYPLRCMHRNYHTCTKSS